MTSQEDGDINDVFEDIFLTEERIIEEHFHHGLEDGRQERSVQEAEDYGHKKGSEIGREIGFYHTIVTEIASKRLFFVLVASSSSLAAAEAAVTAASNLLRAIRFSGAERSDLRRK